MLKFFLTRFGKSNKKKDIIKISTWRNKKNFEIFQDIDKMNNYHSLNFIFAIFKNLTPVNLNQYFFYYSKAMSFIFCGQLILLFLLFSLNIQDFKIWLLCVFINAFFICLYLNIAIISYYKESKKTLKEYLKEDDISLKSEIVESAIDYKNQYLKSMIKDNKKENN